MKNKALFSKVIFQIVDRVNKSRIFKVLEGLNKSQYFSHKQINEIQKNQFKRIINHSYQNVPYYQKLFQKHKINPNEVNSIDDLKRLPLLTKDIIRENAEDLRAINYKTKSYPKFTSGSTGQPGRFYQTKQDFSIIWAAHFRAWEWTGYQIGDRYTKISIHPRESLKKKIQDRLFNCQYLTMGMLNEKNISGYIRKIRKFRPRLIYGYASSINTIASYLERHNQYLNIPAIITTGDNISGYDTSMIEKRFKGKIFDEYGLGGEGIYVAAQCEKGNYHINEEQTIIEIVNKENIITSLYNYAMPLIRYRTGDLIELGDNCNCGRTLKVIKSINGRNTDVVETPNGDILSVYFFAAFFKHLHGFKLFRIIQEKREEIKIQICKFNEYSIKENEIKITEFVNKNLSTPMKIIFEYVKDIPLEKNGKRKFIVNKLK